MHWDINEKNLSDEMWYIYFLLVKRIEDVELENHKSLQEFLAMLVNPEVFKEYMKQKEKRESGDEDSVIFGRLSSGVTKGLIDKKTGTEFTLSDIERMMKQLSES